MIFDFKKSEAGRGGAAGRLFWLIFCRAGRIFPPLQFGFLHLPRSSVRGPRFLRRVSQFFFFFGVVPFLPRKRRAGRRRGLTTYGHPERIRYGSLAECSSAASSPIAGDNADEAFGCRPTIVPRTARVPVRPRRPKGSRQMAGCAEASLGPQATHITGRSARGFSYVRCSYGPERRKNSAIH